MFTKTQRYVCVRDTHAFVSPAFQPQKIKLLKFLTVFYFQTQSRDLDTPNSVRNYQCVVSYRIESVKSASSHS
jgi:hypothetical protein